MFLFLLIPSFIFTEKPIFTEPPGEAISYSSLLYLLKKNFFNTPFYSCNSINDLLEIKKLSFHKCNLDELPHTVISLEQLTGLNLSCNPELRSLPEDIGLLKNLKIFSIQETSIESLPSSFKNLPLTIFCFSQTPLMDTFKFKKFNIDTIKNLPKNMKKYGTYDANSGCIIIGKEEEAFIKSKKNIPGPAGD
jgi:Leucine-rich repeat (LRR) protein